MNFNIIALFRQGKSTVKSHIKNLVEIATADGGLVGEEQRFLDYIAQRNNISPAELKNILTNASKVSFEVPKSEQERFFQLYDLVHMMSVDKTIHSEEVRLCEVVAIKFGYRKEAIKEVIETIRVNIENWIGPGETMQLVSRSIKIYN
jgi:uncharacterized tellurite resistance protein B-like protein